MAGLYIHIPFCKKKCIYCDFYSVALSENFISDYLSALGKEYLYRRNEVGDELIKTVYFGGGTPSLLSVTNLSELLRSFDCSQAEEITVEVNPDDLTADYALELRAAGFNRVSMGVQSFNDDELVFLRRRHDAKKAAEAVAMLKAAGIDNISIDLIFGIPGQTREGWKRSLERALALDVKHISAYNLMYEEGTQLTRMRDKGRFAELPEEDCVVMYNMLADELKAAGFVHYEISNFARPGYESRHNSSYWDFTPYIGLGASAHSFDGRGVRRFNPSSVREYIRKVTECGFAYTEEEECMSELYNDWVMTRLRTKQGMNLVDLKTRFADFYDNAAAICERFVADGLLKRSGDTVSLTDRGVMLSDMVFRELFVVD